MSYRENQLNRLKMSASTVNGNKEYYVSVGYHQQCRLVSIDPSEIVYWHPIAGEMKFDFDSFMPDILKEKLHDILHSQEH